MELLQLYYFNLVAKSEHLTSVAKQLHIAQPALTQTIKRLEQEFGVPLFSHKGRGIQLNEYGKILYKYSEIILKATDSAKEEINDKRQNKMQTVSIVFQAASAWLPTIVGDFHKLYPEICLNIIQASERINRQDYDLMIKSVWSPHRIPQEEILLEERICAALPLNHRLSEKSSIMLSELKNEIFIGMGKDTGLGNMTLNCCLAAGFEPEMPLICENPSVFREFLKMSMGIALIPEKTWRFDEKQDFVIKQISDDFCFRYVCMEAIPGKYKNHAVQLMEAYLKKFFSSL